MISGTFRLTPSASRDINEILEYIQEQSGPDRALHVYHRFLECFSKISDRPGIGHIRDDLADESLRVFVVFSYLVIYRLDTKPVQILRIIHGARDMPSALEEDG